MATPFDVIGEPARRELLDLLRRGPAPVNDLVAATGLSQPSTSRHLRALREAGLVTRRVEGQRRIYEIRLEGFAEIARWLTPYVVMRQRARDAELRRVESPSPSRRTGSRRRPASSP